MHLCSTLHIQTKLLKSQTVNPGGVGIKEKINVQHCWMSKIHKKLQFAVHYQKGIGAKFQ